VLNDVPSRDLRLRLDSIRVNGEEASDAVTIAADGASLRVAIGDLAGGATARVTYAMSVRPDAAPGQAVNAAQVIDSLGDRETYLQQIEALSLAKTKIGVRFTSPTGATYESEAYIDGFSLGNAWEEGFRGSFTVQGVTTLTATEPAPSETPPPAVRDIFYITDPAGTDAELRKLTV